MTTELMIWLIPLLPLLAFFIIIFLTNRNKGLSHSIAVAAAALSWLGSMVVFFRAIAVENLGENPFASSINWFPVGDKWFSIGVLIDPLSAGTLFFVAWTVLMIFIYSIGYHNFGQPKGDHDRPGLPPHGATEIDAHGHAHKVPSVEPMYSRFFAFIGLFAFGMYLLVVSDNLLTLFVGWEIMGLCSYLLIGFWYAKPSARAAMIKAFITTRVGDVVMLLGIAYLYSATGTLNYHAIFYNPEVLDGLASASSGFFGLSVAGLISLLLFVGAIGKSAQWPLHVWLPDAMEGPTPVSAMIHAATMVSAGVYMMIRIFPLLSAGAMFGHSTPTMVFVSFIGTFTAIFAATIAIAHRDIKRVLAYSTISQLGYMIAAIGMGAYIAAAFHLFMHAFFKALLFLGSGSVIHGMEHGVFHTGEHVDPQDMFNMGGLRKKMPVTFWTFLIGGFALSGFPIVTAGFWSKDEILADAFSHHHWIVLITLSVAALFTAFYTMRQITLTFLGKPRSSAAKHAHESKWTMTLPLIVLAFFALTAGWSGIPEHFPVIGGIVPNFIEEFIGETLIEPPEAIAFSYIPLIISLLVSLGGIALGWWVYRDIKVGAADPLEKLLGKVYQWMKNNFYFDEFYDKVFIQPAYRFSREIVYLWMDRKIIDGFLHWIGKVTVEIGKFLRYAIDLPIINGFGDKVGEFGKSVGYWLRPVQTGRIQQYMIMALVSIAAFGAIFYYVLVFGH
jgi:NADH-quinone oxidoreductase subunit L